jgi:hypothetical protein
VLKITDDVKVRAAHLALLPYKCHLLGRTDHQRIQCLKFKTHSSIFLGRFEALNRSLIQKMTNARPPPPAAVAQVAPATVSTFQPQAATGSKSSGTPGAASSGGGVKKKKGKKK